MDLLYANDKLGSYPPSWYAATAAPLDPMPPLHGEAQADVCVIGGGYTGLSAALHLAQAGRRVILLEAQRVGFGASGRNGGQLGSGQRVDQTGLEKMVGDRQAKALWEMGEEAKALVKGLIAEHQIDCHLKPGIAWTGSSSGDVKELHSYAEHLQHKYGYSQIETLDKEACHAICPSPDYQGGALDMGAAHLHPLAFVLGLARAALGAGVMIYESTQVTDLEHGTSVKVNTASGTVTADHVVLA